MMMMMMMMMMDSFTLWPRIKGFIVDFSWTLGAHLVSISVFCSRPFVCRDVTSDLSVSGRANSRTMFEEQTCLRRCTFLNKTFLLIFTDRVCIHGYLQEQLSCIRMGEIRVCGPSAPGHPFSLPDSSKLSGDKQEGKVWARWSGQGRVTQLRYLIGNRDGIWGEWEVRTKEEPWSAAQPADVQAMCVAESDYTIIKPYVSQADSLGKTRWECDPVAVSVSEWEKARRSRYDPNRKHCIPL